MSTPEHRRAHWKGEMRKATSIFLRKHSKSESSLLCPGSVNTLPIDVKENESKDSKDRVIVHISGECPICGTIFQYNAPKQYWFIPRQGNPPQ